MENIEHVVRRPANRLHETPLLLQHGAFHGAWCWEQWLDYFSSLGYEVHAISLPGHGNSPLNKWHINLYTLGNYVDTLASEIGKISPTPVVIGHSMGGAILQKYLENHQLPGAVLLASVPATGIFSMLLRLLRRHPIPTLKGFLTLKLYHFVATPELAHDLFLSPDTIVDVASLHEQLVNESLTAGVRTIIPFARLNRAKTPVLVIAAERDAFFSIAEEKAIAQRYEAEFVVFDGQAHNLVAEPAWQQVADTIDDWIASKLRHMS
jgi:pimeloyl-ACP methyl ester carboxylesterase